jgi:hypothetical protein
MGFNERGDWADNVHIENEQLHTSVHFCLAMSQASVNKLYTGSSCSTKELDTGE